MTEENPVDLAMRKIATLNQMLKDIEEGRECWLSLAREYLLSPIKDGR